MFCSYTDSLLHLENDSLVWLFAFREHWICSFAVLYVLGRKTLLGTRATGESIVGLTTPQFTGPGKVTVAWGKAAPNPFNSALWESCFLTEVCDTFYQILLMESQLLNRNIITNTLRHYHNAHTCASFAHNPVVREIGLNGEIFTI